MARPVTWIKNKIKSFLKEQEDPLFGTPVIEDSMGRYGGRYSIPVWQAEQYQDKLQTIRTIQQLNRARHLSRYMVEVSPNAYGGIKGLNRYVVGKGAEISVQPLKNKTNAYKTLTEEVDTHIEELKKAWNFKAMVQEIYHRYLTDGEVFLELSPDETGITKAFFIEPDYVVPPYDQSWEGPWSWGINTGADLTRTSIPIAYNIRNPHANTERQVPAQFIVHLKRCSNLNQKRGIPALYPCQEDVTGSKKLRNSATQGESVRSSIAYIREWAMADQGSINTLQTVNSTGSYTNYNQNGGTQTVITQQIQPGTVQDIPEGAKFQPGPTSPNSEAVVTTVRLNLEAVASALEVPYWLVSGDNTASSYASSLTTESPFIRLVESEQEMVGDFVDDMFTRSIEIAMEQGALDDSVLDKLDIHVNFKSPVMRNLLEETQRNQLLHDANQLSAESWSALEGRDYDKEQANLQKEASSISPLTGVDQLSTTIPATTPQTMSGMMRRETGVAA